MFKDIGKTLCIIGGISFWLFIAAGAIFLMVWFSDGMYYKVYGLLIVPYFEFTSAFIFALPIYGFGKLIQDVQAIKDTIKKNKELP